MGDDRFDALAARWLQLRTRGFTAETVRLYRLYLADLVDFVGPDRPIGTIGPEELELWAVQPRKDGQPYADNSYNTRLKPVRGFFHWALNAELIDRDPTRTLDAVDTPEPIWSGLTLDQVQRLLWVCDMRDRMIMLVGLQLGLRRREIAGMRVEHWDTAGGVLHVVEAKGGQTRVLPVDGEIREAMSAWITLGLDGRRIGPFWPSRDPDDGISKEYVLTIVKRRAGQAQVPATTHTLRHTFAQDRLAVGVPLKVVSAWLGHKNMKTTTRYGRAAAHELEAYSDVCRYLGQALAIPAIAA